MDCNRCKADDGKFLCLLQAGNYIRNRRLRVGWGCTVVVNTVFRIIGRQQIAPVKLS